MKFDDSFHCSFNEFTEFNCNRFNANTLCIFIINDNFKQYIYQNLNLQESEFHQRMTIFNAIVNSLKTLYKLQRLCFESRFTRIRVSLKNDILQCYC